MHAAERFCLHDQTLWLSPDRCIYWEEQQMLITSDTHFGKTGHFRKSGIAVPQNVYKEDMQRLVNQVQHYKPQQLLIVGDLFHSKANKELEFFTKWRNDFSSLHIQLVKGNHDVLKRDWYSSVNISVADSHFHVERFCFIHDIDHACDTGTDGYYYFSGHIHPCVTLRGIAKQAVSLPCYYFTETFAVLPAFSKFTGTANIDRKAAAQIFAIIPSNISKGQHGSVMKL